MREDDSNWFTNLQDELPSPEDLTPLSQTLITPHLALAFNIIQTPNHQHPSSIQPNQHPPPISISISNPNSQPNSGDFDSPELGDEPARTLKRPRLVWTPQLHKRFVDAVAYLGIKNAVPKTIMQLMNVDGLTRENVASHLQKYRLYLKRMQGLSPGGHGDTATDRLFASSPVPAQFLHQSRPSGDHFSPYAPVAALQNQQQQIHGQLQQPRYGQIGSLRNQQVVHRAGGDEFESANGGKKVLTLFPTGDD